MLKPAPSRAAQQEGHTLSSNSVIPSPDQLTAARLTQWHQTGEALLTFENLRSWLNAAGLVLFTPRSAQLPAPAPSMVESVLGVPNAAPTLADTEQTRSLLARLIAEGAAVPLNLLGAPTGTETPDFVCSAAIFPYIFTLRGDKAWKQPPTTSGAIKVSPLALNTYTLLGEKGPTSAYDLVTQLGKEVTEAAVLRSLTELWAHLRVLPIQQQDGKPTLWEVTSSRFTKQIKAGANAGQPTALSALISLYLGQALLATEEEIETFISPLAARSRIRDVVHALLGARQLQTIVIEGKTLLHVTGELPVFLAPEVPIAEVMDAVAVDAEAVGDSTEGSAPRISKFVAKPRKIGTGFVRKPFGAAAPSTRERRPFTRESNRPDRPSFTKPWAEEKADRLAAASAPSRAPDAGANETSALYQSSETAAPRTFEKRPSFGGKPSFSRKPSYGDKSSFSRKPSFGARPSFGDKPGFSRDRNDARPPRRDFGARPDFGSRPAADSGGSTGDFAPRKTFSKPGTFGRKREGGFSPRPSFGRDDARPPRREFAPRAGGDSRPSRPSFGGRPEGGRPSYPPRDNGAGASGESSGPRYRKFDAPRGDRPARPYNSERPSRPYSSERPASSGYAGKSSSGGYAGKPSFGDRKPFAGKSSFGDKKPYAGKPSFGDKKPYTGKSSFGDKKPYSAKSSGGYAGKSGGYAGSSERSYPSKKPFNNTASGKPSGRSFSSPGKPAGTFDKFKGNAKPFGKRPPARKYKPREGDGA